jgi:hypothetical protein
MLAGNTERISSEGRHLVLLHLVPCGQDHGARAGPLEENRALGAGHAVVSASLERLSERNMPQDDRVPDRRTTCYERRRPLLVPRARE